MRTKRRSVKHGSDTSIRRSTVFRSLARPSKRNDSWPVLFFLTTGEDFRSHKTKIRKALARYGLFYARGVYIVPAASRFLTETLKRIIQTSNLGSLEDEFERTLKNIESDPVPRLRQHALCLCRSRSSRFT